MRSTVYFRPALYLSGYGAIDVTLKEKQNSKPKHAKKKKSYIEKKKRLKVVVSDY